MSEAGWAAVHDPPPWGDVRAGRMVLSPLTQLLRNSNQNTISHIIHALLLINETHWSWWRTLAGRCDLCVLVKNTSALFYLANHWSNVGAYYLSQVKHNKDQISLTTTTNRSEDISQKIETNASMLHAGNWAWMYIMSCFMYQYLWCLSFTAYCLSWFDVMRCRFELNRRQNLCKQQICCCFLIQQQCVITGWRWAAASVPAGEHLQGQQGLAAPCSRRHTPNLPGQTEAWCCFPPSSSLFF